jgi:hypothetical protein
MTSPRPDPTPAKGFLPRPPGGLPVAPSACWRGAGGSLGIFREKGLSFVKRISASRPRRKCLVLAAAVACSAIALLAGTGVAAAQAGDAHAAVSGGTWGTAREVAGALNTGGSAGVSSVSCRSAGNCSAGGSATGTSGQLQAFVVNERNGTWGTAQKIATGPDAEVGSVSCAGAGNCSAGGSYGRSPHFHAFVVNERNGTWGAAHVVAGAAAQLISVSCASAGNCSASGSTISVSGSTASGQAFVVNERNGTWGAAQVVPGSAALNTGGNAQVEQVSCALPGRCSAGGYFTGFTLKAGFRGQAFVVSET